VTGDTGAVSLGLGAFASRLTVTAGSSVYLAAKAVKERAIQVAADMLEAAKEDLELNDGDVHVKGVPDLKISLGHIARALRGVPGYSLPSDVEAGLESTKHFRTDSLAYAHSFQACEVEVDIATGEVTILRFVAIQDSGRLVNPMIVEGQMHGGIVHGIGNALFERMGYDDHGQPVTTTFADYLLPTSTEIPNLEIMYHESPSPLNPLGAKGVGEGGTVPVAAAVISAVEDALSPFGVKISETPITPERILEIVEQAQH
jgi:aerobic carbon-monoxide dehydrogenase large subunit